MLSDARLSPDAVYRYLLTRVWDANLPVACWVMLNPSTADASADDPTIRRCVGFAKAWGAGSVAVVNLFALRATDPKALPKHPEPVGPDNDATIRCLGEGASRGGAFFVAGWGANGDLRGRGKAVASLLRSLGVRLECLGVTAAGHPRHPLYVRGDQPRLALDDVSTRYRQ